MEITKEDVEYIIQSSFYQDEFIPEESIPLYNISQYFISRLLMVKDVSLLNQNKLKYIFNKISNRNIFIEEKNENVIFDPSEWLPDETFQSFRENFEDCSFAIYDVNSDLKWDYSKKFYNEWLTKSKNKLNLISKLHGSTHYLNIREKLFALCFNNKVEYLLTGVGLRQPEGICLCITFQLDRYLDNNNNSDNFIISDFNSDPPYNTRGISYSGNSFKIWGANNKDKYESIKVNKIDSKWWTFYIEWSSEKERYGKYIINNKLKGSFETLRIDGIIDPIIRIGAQKEYGFSGFKGSIAFIDIFKIPINKKIPNHLVDLIFDKHAINSD